MSKPVKYFMWGFQPHLQISASNTLESLVEALDPAIGTRLQLVGFLLQTEREKRHPICVCPDDAPYQPDSFTHVQAHSEHLGSYDPLKDGIHTHPVAQQGMIDRIASEGKCAAIKFAIDATDKAKWNTYVRGPFIIEGYEVFVIAQVSVNDSAPYYGLTKDKSAGCFTKEFSVARSLIEAAVEAALFDISTALDGKEPLQRVEREIAAELHRAGRRMMYLPALAGKTADGLHDQFRICDSLSTLPYESAEGSGRMYYIARDHPSAEIEIRLKDEIGLRNVRGVRKLLEATSRDTALLADGSVVYGLGRVDSDYDESREDVFAVDFLGRSKWELLHAEKCLMQVEFGVPRLRQHGFPQAVLRSMLKRVLHLEPEQANALATVAKLVARSPHGSMLVISTDAKNEAKRLATQSTRIEPTLLSRHNAQNLASIDGAILIDVDVKCHAFGVILDGSSHEKCTPSRGARFNSAIKYALNRDDCVVVVQSEDGMIDIVPHLRQQLSKREIKRKIEDLEQLVEQDEPEANSKSFAGRRKLESIWNQTETDPRRTANSVRQQQTSPDTDAADIEGVHGRYQIF